MAKPKKSKATPLEIEDLGRPKVLNVERLSAWLKGRGSPFEARLAALTWVVPPPDLQTLSVFLELAWTPETAAVLHDVLKEAGRDPGRHGLARALRSARRVWRDMFSDPAPNRGGRPTAGARDITVLLAFRLAQRANPDAAKAAIMRDVIKRDGAKLGLTSLRKFEDVLVRVKRRYPWAYDMPIKPSA